MSSLSAEVVLIIIDLQPDFMPGGPLACHDGDAIVPDIDRLLRQRRYRHVVATQDWHPCGHVSFASSHPGRQPFEQISLHGQPQTLWPDHCVQGTAGAELHPAVDWSSLDTVIRKGGDPRVDSYSGFRENYGPDGSRPATGLTEWLRRHGIEEVHLCGLARDVCVRWTAQDAMADGFRTTFLWTLTRPDTPHSDSETLTALRDGGVALLGDDLLLRD